MSGKDLVFYKFLADVLVTGIFLPLVCVVITTAVRRTRRAPAPSWADVAGILFSLDLILLPNVLDLGAHFPNSQLREFRGPIFLFLAAFSLLVWLVLMTALEKANEQNFDFATMRYQHRGRRFWHWVFGVFPVLILYAAHLVPFVFPDSIEL